MGVDPVTCLTTGLTWVNNLLILTTYHHPFHLTFIIPNTPLNNNHPSHLTMAPIANLTEIQLRQVVRMEVPTWDTAHHRYR